MEANSTLPWGDARIRAPAPSHPCRVALAVNLVLGNSSYWFSLNFLVITELNPPALQPPCHGLCGSWVFCEVLSGAWGPGCWILEGFGVDVP